GHGPGRGDPPIAAVDETGGRRVEAGWLALRETRAGPQAAGNLARAVALVVPEPQDVEMVGGRVGIDLEVDGSAGVDTDVGGEALDTGIAGTRDPPIGRWGSGLCLLAGDDAGHGRAAWPRGGDSQGCRQHAHKRHQRNGPATSQPPRQILKHAASPLTGSVCRLVPLDDEYLAHSTGRLPQIRPSRTQRRMSQVQITRALIPSGNYADAAMPQVEHTACTAAGPTRRRGWLAHGSR